MPPWNARRAWPAAAAPGGRRLRGPPCSFQRHLVGSYPQPEWLIDRERLAGRFPPRVRARELWRIPEAYLARGPGRRDHRGDQGAGGRRTRHHHRRRDPARELLEPLCDRARWGRSRQPRHARSIAAVTRIRYRGWWDRSVAATPSACAISSSLRAPHAARSQGHGARAVHHGAAGADRLLRRQSRASRNGLRDRGQRRDPRPVQCRRRRGADRRALHAGAAGGSARVRPARAQPRARGRERHDRGAYLLRLRGHHPRRGRPDTRSCRSWPSAAVPRCRSRPRSRTSTARYSRRCPGKKIILGVIDLSDHDRRVAGAGGEPHPRARCRSSIRAISWSHQTAA